MKKLSIILIYALVAFASCTKSKEVHPELGDGVDEIVTVGMKDVHVKYVTTDMEELNKAILHYSLAEVQQFTSVEMNKHEYCFEVRLNDLWSDTLYQYLIELFPNTGSSYVTTGKTFRTQVMDEPEPPTPQSGVPEGAINGLFTINENGDQVYFSQGNLRYQASTNTWRFAEHQWDYVGNENENISQTYDGWIDLFGWGTSGWNHGAVCYQPWSTRTGLSDYCAYGSYNDNLSSQTGQADWGYNAISNGGNLTNQWRTLSTTEWCYVIISRSPLSGIRYAKAVVNGVNGIILLPDNWNPAIHVLNNTNESSAPFTVNEITVAEWGTMESSGAVFLPAAGRRSGSSFDDYQGSGGGYWSSSCYSDGAFAFHVSINSSDLNPNYYDYKYYGRSVRLVRLAE